MWIPYDIRAALKAEGDRASIKASRADGTARAFLVGFFLRNPVTQAWELDLVAPPADAEFPLSGAVVSFGGNEGGKLNEVVYRLVATSHDDALGRAFSDLRLRLLAWGAQAGRGMAIAGWRIADPAHGARWRCTPFRPSALHLDVTAADAIPADLAPVAELAQRARNAPDAAVRLMSAAGVLKVACTGAPPLADSGAATLTITREMLVHAVATDAEPQLIGRSLGEFLAIIRPLCQRLMSPDGMFAPICDDLDDQIGLARHANLADLLAHRLITAELSARRARNATVGSAAPPAARRVVEPC